MTGRSNPMPLVDEVLLASTFGTLLSSQGADAHRSRPLGRSRGNPSNLPAVSHRVKLPDAELGWLRRTVVRSLVEDPDTGVHWRFSTRDRPPFPVSVPPCRPNTVNITERSGAKSNRSPSGLARHQVQAADLHLPRDVVGSSPPLHEPFRQSAEVSLVTVRHQLAMSIAASDRRPRRITSHLACSRCSGPTSASSPSTRTLFT
jgi:hypothetical protein